VNPCGQITSSEGDQRQEKSSCSVWIIISTNALRPDDLLAVQPGCEACPALHVELVSRDPNHWTLRRPAARLCSRHATDTTLETRVWPACYVGLS